MSYLEWTQNRQAQEWPEHRVNQSLEEHMVAAHRAAAQAMQEYRCSMRTAAFVVAVQRVKRATDLRGLG